VPEPDGPASRDGSADGGCGGVARVGDVGEDGGQGSVRGSSGPWGQPLGSARSANCRCPNWPVSTVIQRSSALSSLPSSSP
jgi:hypothetical protein